MSSSVELSFTVPAPSPMTGKAGNASAPSSPTPFAGLVENIVTGADPAKDGSEADLVPVFAMAATAAVAVEPPPPPVQASGVPATPAPSTAVAAPPAATLPTAVTPPVPAFPATLSAQALETVGANTGSQPVPDTASGVQGIVPAATADADALPVPLPVPAAPLAEVLGASDQLPVEAASRVQASVPKMADPAVSVDTAIPDLHEAAAQKPPSQSNGAIVIEPKVATTASAVITDETAVIVPPTMAVPTKATAIPLSNGNSQDAVAQDAAAQGTVVQGIVEGKPVAPASSSPAQTPVQTAQSQPHIPSAPPEGTPELAETVPSPENTELPKLPRTVDRAAQITAETVNARDPSMGPTAEPRPSSPTSTHIVLPESIMPSKPAPVVQAPLMPTAFNIPLPTVTAAIATEIVAHHRRGSSSFDIRLDPPELGRIDVRLDVDHTGRVRSTLVVERIETLDMLRSDVKSLERALEQAGLRSDPNSVSLSLRDDRNGSGHNGRAFHQSLMDESPILETEPLAASVTAATTRSTAASGLDIRV